MAIAVEGSPKESRKKQFIVLRSALDDVINTFRSHYQDLADYALPRRLRFNITDNNKGDKRNQKIIDSTATLALGTLQSGLMGGVTSPARPWFQLGTADQELVKLESIKTWLHTVTTEMNATFLRSNIYKTLPILYGDIGQFGTGAMLIEEDFDTVLRAYSMPIGSYRIALNDKGNVEVFVREFQQTVRQVVEKFGVFTTGGELTFDNLSMTVKAEWETGRLDTMIDICHVIQRNPRFDPDKFGSKPFESVYFEFSQGKHADKNFINDEVYLRDKGYDFFPVLAPRWQVTGEDAYGTSCPGMTALGDVKALQTKRKREAQAEEKSLNPPMTAPTSMKGAALSILPGDITFTDEREGQKGFRPVYELRYPLEAIRESIRDTQFLIKRAYFEDLFLLLSNTDRRQITAREVEERHQEKLLALGPVLQQLNDDLLDPLIDITFQLMQRQGRIPPPPPELADKDLKVEYISIMHQAQKLAGLEGLERFMEFTLNTASANPEILDKVDFDKAIEEYGNITGMIPGIVVPDEIVAEIRLRREQIMQQRENAERMAQGAGTAKDLAASDLGGNNALAALTEQASAGALQ